MGGGCCSCIQFSLIILSFLCRPCFSSPINSRDTLEIGIGIGIGIGTGSSPPPSSSPSGCPPPPPPPPEICPPPPKISPHPPPPPPPPKGPPPSPPRPTLPKPPPSPHKPPPSDNQDFINEEQRISYYVIKRFKKTITCDPLHITRTWKGKRPCTYKGFRCDTPPNRKITAVSAVIASVDFNSYGICAPTITGFLDKLPDLAIFHANSNNLTGNVPDLTHLKYLYELDFSNNNFTGPYPQNLLPLNGLEFLDVRFNKFSGSVPGSAFLLKNDIIFFLNNNMFNCPLPAEFGSTLVSYLVLANNGFTGPIPRSIGNLSHTLIEILFLSNRLSGCLPYEIGLLENVTVFDAGFNEITGPIPLSFGCLRKVEQLNLAGNLLYGEVPDAVCRLAATGHLRNLSLSGNYFTSLGESCFGLVSRGVLNIQRNCIKGAPQQRSAAECGGFLGKEKNCPLLTYVPCHLNYEEGGSGFSPAMAMATTTTTGTANAYATYAAAEEKGGAYQFGKDIGVP